MKGLSSRHSRRSIVLVQLASLSHSRQKEATQQCSRVVPAVATCDMQTRCRAAIRPGFPYASLTGDMYPPSTSYPLCRRAMQQILQCPLDSAWSSHQHRPRTCFLQWRA